MKILKVIIILVLVFIGIILLLFNSLFFVPAVMSYKYDCFPMLMEEGIESGEIVGTYNSVTNEVNVYVEETHPEYEYILKHEKCHQFLKTYTSGGSCFIPLTMIAEEYTCYFYEIF